MEVLDNLTPGNCVTKTGFCEKIFYFTFRMWVFTDCLTSTYVAKTFFMLLWEGGCLQVVLLQKSVIGTNPVAMEAVIPYKLTRGCISPVTSSHMSSITYTDALVFLSMVYLSSSILQLNRPANLSLFYLIKLLSTCRQSRSKNQKVKATLSPCCWLS